MQRWKERYITAMSESPRNMSKIPNLYYLKNKFSFSEQKPFHACIAAVY